MTISEQRFEQFCRENDIDCTRLLPDGKTTPDYKVLLGGETVIIEVKELVPNEEEKQAIQDLEEKHSASWGSAKIGDRIRTKINHAKRQIERLAAGNSAGVIVLYDTRPVPIKGIFPYEIEVAMYGWESIDLHVPDKMGASVRFGKHRFGKGKKMRHDSRTYISALGVLRETSPDGRLHLDLYHNVFAAKPIPIKRLVDRKDISIFTVPPGNGNEFRGWAKVVSDEEYSKVNQSLNETV